jgi:hypothetical protein
MSGKAVLDSNTIIDVFNGLIPLEAFEQALPDTEQTISVITEIELLSFPRITEEQEARIKRFLAELEIVPLTEEIKRKTIEFRRRANIKLPDSIYCRNFHNYQRNACYPRQETAQCIFPRTPYHADIPLLINVTKGSANYADFLGYRRYN